MASKQVNFLIGFVIYILFYLRRRKGMPKKVAWVPSPPLVGSLFTILRHTRSKTFLDVISQWHVTLGQTIAYHLPGKVMISTIDPRNIEHFLKTNFKNYIKGHIFGEPFTDLLGEGIFNADGEIWHYQRKISSAMFTKNAFENHIYTVVDQNTAKVMDILDRTKETIDTFNLMNRFTLDTIGQIGFSTSVGSLEDPSSPFLKSFDRAQQILLLRFWVNPAWKLMRFLGVGWEPELKEHLERLDTYARGIVQQLRAKVEVGDDNSFVGLFIKSESSKSNKETQVNAARQETFLRDMVLNFLIAGRDTTAQCISWTLFELTQHPVEIKRIREEVAKVCGDGPVKYEHIKKLSYVQAVLDEGLRLHPSVPMDGKLAIDDDTLPDGTDVKAGAIVQFTAYAQGRCKEIWGEDACSFRPERWQEFPNKPSSFMFSAFNAGPRECLGRRLAEMEMTIFLATVLRDFDVTLDADPASVCPDAQLTIGMNALPLKWKRVAKQGVSVGGA
jgi:cytochrome P450